MNVLLSAYIHRRDKMWGQFTFVFHDIVCSRIYRFLIILVHVNAKRLRRQRMHVSAGTQGVLANVGPRKVWLDTGRGFRDERNSSGGRYRGYFIVARRERDVFWNPNLVVEKVRVGFAVRFKLRKRALLCPKTIALHPRLATNKSHHLVHQIDGSRRTIRDV